MTKAPTTTPPQEDEKNSGVQSKTECKSAIQLTMEAEKPVVHKDDPFGKSILAHEIFKHRQLEELKEIIRAAISQQSMMLVIGPPGVGKTTGVRSVTDRLPVNKFLVVYLGQDQNGGNLLRRLALSLGVQPKRCRPHLLMQISQALADNLRDGGKRILIIADEAHLLDDTTLEDLRLLSNVDYDRQSPFTLILMGQPWLRARLKTPYSEPLIQRLRYRYCLEGLSKQDTFDYVRARLSAAGIDVAIFRDAALEQIFAYSEGIPRRINNIASHLLLKANAAGLKQVDASMVKQLADSQDL
jgi:general secretion pathway protein A